MNLSEFLTPTADRTFEDYDPGAVYEFGPVVVDEDELVTFATRYDPQAMHVDAQWAATGPFGGLIASGWHTVSLLMRLFVEGYLPGAASLTSPGVDELRWTRPVRPGDALRLRVTTVSKRVSRSKPDRGIVISILEGINQDGEVVASMRAMNLIGLRTPAASASAV